VGDDAPFLAPASAVAQEPRDACGAGDCFAAAAAQVLRTGGLLTEAVTEAVRAASEFVARGGASAAPGLTVPPEPGRPAAGPPPAGSALDLVADVRRRGGRVVATGGCFDLLHAGHVATLEAARALGDCLVVCINSDDSIRRLKGPQRPLQSEHDRVRVLSALRCVDAVLVFGEDTPTQLLSTVRPDVWVKGGDYTGTVLAEAEVLGEWGGEVVTVPYVAGHSTSELVNLARR
jgi:rfaE bifunctional protein nucleotidyltransferase chain/domain